MKTLLTAALIFMTSIIYSGNDTTRSADSSFSSEVSDIILDNKATPALHLTGTANIIFSVNEHRQIIVENIFAENYTAAFHIRCLLKGKVLHAVNVSPGKSYEMTVNFDAVNSAGIF